MTAVAWSKVSAGFFWNRKIREVGPDGALLFLFVLCKNAERDSKGSIPVEEIEPRHVAEVTRLPVERVEAAIRDVVTARLVTVVTGQVTIVGWGNEWSKRPLTDAEKQANYRARKSDSVTAVTCQSNVTEERRGEETRSKKPVVLSVTDESNALPTQVTESSTNTQQSLPIGVPVKRPKKPVASMAPDLAVKVDTVLEKLSERTLRAFNRSQAHRAAVARLLTTKDPDTAKPYTVWDLRIVIDYCGKHMGWDDSPEMKHNMNPETLFRVTKFPARLATAKTLYPETDPDEAKP